MSLHTASTSPASGGSLSADALVPTHLWIVGGLSLLRNALGAFDYVMTPMQVEAYMSAFTAGQLRYFYSFPAWVDAAWAVAASLVGLAGSTTYTTLFTNGMQIMGGPGVLVFSAAVGLVTIGLFLYAGNLSTSGVLR